MTDPRLYRKALDILLETVPYEEGEKFREVYEVMRNGAPCPEWAAQNPDEFHEVHSRFVVPCDFCNRDHCVYALEIVDEQAMCLGCRHWESKYCIESLEEALVVHCPELALWVSRIEAPVRKRIKTLNSMDKDMRDMGLRLELLDALQTKLPHALLSNSFYVSLTAESLRLHGLVDSQEAESLKAEYESTGCVYLHPYQNPSNPTSFWEALKV